MRLALWALVLLGCNHDALPQNAADLGSTFCSGAARVEYNGHLAESPFVSAHVDFLNCCEAAHFEVVSMQLPEPLTVMWRHQVGTMPTTPMTLDLAQLPSGWEVSVTSGSDSYHSLDGELSGTLTVGRGLTSYEMSACLTAAEKKPHPVLHSLRFWTPTVTAQ